MQEKLQNSTDARIHRVLHGLRPPIALKNRPPLRWTLAERMAALHVPGVSIAIIDNTQIVWAGGFGLKESGTQDSVTTSTLFQAASISKPIAASATLRLVEAEKLSLDEDVNSYLKSWKVPENNFTAQEKVTLRRILSHNAGITVSGFPGYKSGDPVPTLRQILDGEKPANNPAIRVDTIPGSLSRYSGGGFTILQQLLIDITGESFPLLLKRLVFDPVGMALSTYEQLLPKSRFKEAASGHDGEGVALKGKWHNYPEMAAAGLWTTPTELAKWALEISRAWSGRSTKLLSNKIAAQMLTIQKPPFGLGSRLEGTDQTLGFSHGGGNWGFRAEFVTYPAAGKGAVVMTNSDLGGILVSEVFQSIATEYLWPARLQSEREVVTLATSELDGLVGMYTAPNPPSASTSYEVSCEGGRLFVEMKEFWPKSEIYPASADSFFTTDGLVINFSRDSFGRAVKVKAGGNTVAIRKE